ncbi:MAG: helix-hairpin-helix domain-containing protein [Daejeonella sp.]
MKKLFKSYFSFSKKEFNGIIVLFFLIILVLAFPYLFEYFKVPEVYDSRSFREEVARFESSARKSDKNFANRNDESAGSTSAKAIYFEFDPNNLTEEKWLKLGLSSRQIKVIKNYEAKGGKFFKKEDLQKIYSITAAQYSKLEPYIAIEKNYFGRKEFSQKSNSERVEKRYPAKKEFEVVELNSADSTSLETIKGIGPAFAIRILKYRNRLGGFYSVEQLKEVYGLDSSMFNNLKTQVKVNRNSIVKTNINTAVFEDLKQSPYLTYKQINAIINYRKQHGLYKSIEDFKKIAILNDGILRKIEPYIIFE